MILALLMNTKHKTQKQHKQKVFRDPGCGSAWLERLVWDQEVAGSNPVTPMSIPLGVNKILLRGCSSMVEHQPSKLDTWVRFPSPALVMIITVSL